MEAVARRRGSGEERRGGSGTKHRAWEVGRWGGEAAAGRWGSREGRRRTGGGEAAAGRWGSGSSSGGFRLPERHEATWARPASGTISLDKVFYVTKQCGITIHGNCGCEHLHLICNS
ncbi:hypothetical protein GUJ93_ZPchr0012g19644 [Zizania palustris]|uniref:Uncharacterized protein n=1 Tax=Zizania palustris TaxID=103762 RepID=A0A8J6BT40_ZIZPA|nr:hypothetical protein GUJ93_ZPchr0012g19644 [Zizania palustris]